MINEIKVFKKKLHFRQPFKIAYEEVKTASVILLALYDERGRVGLGSAAPDETVTGENVDETLRTMKKKLDEDFFSHPEEDYEWYVKKIKDSFSGQPSAQAAVETAVLHLAAQRMKIDPRDIYGRCRGYCNAAITVGIMPLFQTVAEVKKQLKKGFQIIKLKCGISPESDIDRILAVRKIIPKNLALIVDANQGYSFEQAKRVLLALRGQKIAAIEQPISASRTEDLKGLRRLATVPIIADESAKTGDEALKLLRQGYADGINVKLMKFGGPVACQEIVKSALKMKKIVMLGCMYESNISITAAAYLALAYPVNFIDLDSGSLDFDDDPAEKGAYIEDGKLRIKGIPRFKNGMNFKNA